MKEDTRPLQMHITRCVKNEMMPIQMRIIAEFAYDILTKENEIRINNHAWTAQEIILFARNTLEAYDMYCEENYIYNKYKTFYEQYCDKHNIGD